MAISQASSSSVRPEENAVWDLRQHRLFHGMPDEFVTQCKTMFVQRTYPAKTVLFAQGDPAQLVYLVKRGKVRITRLQPDGRELSIAILCGGDIFGEEVVFAPNIVRTTQATVIDEAYLCSARMKDLFAILSQSPVVALNIAKYFQEQRNDAIATVEEVMFLKVSDRILRLFGRLASEYGVADPRGTRIDLKLTHIDIAQHVGSTRETVSLEMGHLARAGRVIVDNGYILPA